MLKKNIRKGLVFGIYGSVIITIIISIFFVERSLVKDIGKDKDYIYVMKNILNRDIPVVGTKLTMLKPFTDSNIKKIRGFYNYQDDKENQEKSLIYHDNTYMQNSGIDYSGVDNFDVIAVLDGEVISVSEDPLLGKSIEIRHNNELISVYQSLSDISVKKGDAVLRSQVIGKSGLSNIAKDLGDHLHFEIYYKGKVVNPEEYFDKKLE